jgi:hypothetical protein
MTSLADRSERLGNAVQRITITWDRVSYGCGCWRDLRGTLRDCLGRRGGCRGYHKRRSPWPHGRIPYRRYGSP